MNTLEQELNKDTEMRDEALATAKKFKTVWVDLGRTLYTIYKDKLYRAWGYQTFDGYVTKEIGIKKQTSVKLLRSYYFLEKDEPAYLKDDFIKNTATAKVPEYETIDILRRAKAKKGLEKEDYETASQLRDQIRKLEREAGHNSQSAE